MLYLGVVLAIFPMFSWSINLTKTWVTAFDLPIHKVINSMTTIHWRRPTRRNCRGINMSDFETSSLCLDKKHGRMEFFGSKQAGGMWDVAQFKLSHPWKSRPPNWSFRWFPCRRFPYCPEAKFEVRILGTWVHTGYTRIENCYTSQHVSYISTCVVDPSIIH